MTDFFQNGIIATFHKLGEPDLKYLESELREFSQIRPIALVLPSLYREYASGALPKIMQVLAKVKYLNEIILCLDKANADQFREVTQAFRSIKKLTIIWNDGPGMKKLYNHLEEHNLSPGKEGKGRAVWIALGYVLARRKSRVIVMHDCDIVNYNRLMLARLCYPVTSPHSEYEFCKGYYSRVTNRLYGRATRLFFTPFVRSLQRILGYLPFLVYMDSFLYSNFGLGQSFNRGSYFFFPFPGFNQGHFILVTNSLEFRFRDHSFLEKLSHPVIFFFNFIQFFFRSRRRSFRRRKLSLQQKF